MRSKLLSPRLVRGCHDVLPLSYRIRSKLVSQFKSTVELYGYRRVDTPILEHGDIYQSLGSDSDVNTHETFYVSSMDNGNGNSNGTENSNAIVLRPEGTAGVNRLIHTSDVFKNALHNNTYDFFDESNVKIWYYGSMFRHERPQLGRLREFKQVGVEHVGSNNMNDIEMIEIAHEYLSHSLQVPVSNLTLNINYIGTQEQRHIYNMKLRDFFQCATVFPKLSPSLRAKIARRGHSGAAYIKILDDLNGMSVEDLNVIRNRQATFPLLKHCLSETDTQYFQTLCDQLTALNIHFQVDDCLVRGLDYYNGLVFELGMSLEKGKQKTVCAGGNYHVMQRNSIGFAIGVERLVKALQHMEHEVVRDEAGALNSDTILVAGAPKVTAQLCRTLRRHGVKCISVSTPAKVHKLIKKAIEHGYKYVVVGKDSEEGPCEIRVLGENYKDSASVLCDHTDVVKELSKLGVL